MAQDVTAPVPPDVPAETALVSRRERRTARARGSSYRLRFGLLYVFLAMVFGAGIGAFLVLSTRPAPEPEPAWSAWQPTGSPEARLKQIADRIPQAYRQGGKQLTVSNVSPLTITLEQGQVPIQTVFVLPDTSRGLAEEDDIDRFDGAAVASFALCGFGTGCALAGKASPAARTLVDRQALELSLYALKYVDEVDSVIVFMPPAPDGEPGGTVFLTRDDVAPELRRPLTELLPTRAPTVGGGLNEVEKGHLLRLIDPKTYGYEVDQGPDGNFLLALIPPSAQTQSP